MFACFVMGAACVDHVPLFRGDDDFQAVRRLLQRIFASDGSPDNGTVGDLDWWRFTDEDPDAIWASRIWLDDGGDVVGFAWPSGGCIDHFRDPAYRDLDSDIVAWARAQIRDIGKYSSMTAFADDSHAWRQEQLRELGFERGGEAFRYWHCRLDNLPAPQPLGDYVIRNVCCGRP